MVEGFRGLPGGQDLAVEGLRPCLSITSVGHVQAGQVSHQDHYGSGFRGLGRSASSGLSAVVLGIIWLGSPATGGCD